MNLHFIRNWNEEYGYSNDEEKYVKYFKKKKFVIYSFENNEIHDYNEWLYDEVFIGKSYIFKERTFCNINYSFLHFQKKCKKYYKDRINFYKNPKNLISRQLFAKY
mgnify:FL=1